MTRSYTRYLMALSALVMFGLGVLLTFAPAKTLLVAGAPRLPILIVAAQACGALYLGFAVLNWMAKENLIGGIYSRPVAIGNFLHFFAGAMALIKAFSALPKSTGVFALVAFYLMSAVAFGLVIFRHPKTD